MDELGEEHLKTGRPIVYTSADSVFQIATHEDIIPLDSLYEFSLIAREILTGEHSVGRVIARPFRGDPGRFERNNAGRKDFSVLPPETTLLDVLHQKGLSVIGIGKIGDLFGHVGLTHEIHTDNNEDGVNRIIESLNDPQMGNGLIFANLVDFDMVFGHRRNAEGYAKALESFDRRLPEILGAMTPNDLLIITADHGCDPTYDFHTDHTREYVPLLVYGEAIKQNIDLGIRETFADCGQTIADILCKVKLKNGKSFKQEILHG